MSEGVGEKSGLPAPSDTVRAPVTVVPKGGHASWGTDMPRRLGNLHSPVVRPVVPGLSFGGLLASGRFIHETRP